MGPNSPVHAVAGKHPDSTAGCRLGGAGCCAQVCLCCEGHLCCCVCGAGGQRGLRVRGLERRREALAAVCGADGGYSTEHRAEKHNLCRPWVFCSTTTSRQQAHSHLVSKFNHLEATGSSRRAQKTAPERIISILPSLLLRTKATQVIVHTSTSQTCVRFTHLVAPAAACKSLLLLCPVPTESPQLLSHSLCSRGEGCFLPPSFCRLL
jgi:hypothetical protein